MSDSRTVWVTRESGAGLANVWSAPPRWVEHKEFSVWREVGDSRLFQLHNVYRDFWTLGLHEAPEPGSCWRVEWKESRDAGCSIECELGYEKLVPIDTDVTEELRAKSEGQ